jgi:formyltetrahydrofolate synthetase
MLAGDIITLPGLPSKPNALDIDLMESGEVVGLLGT